MLYGTRKSLEQHGDKVSPEIRGNIESALSNLEDKLKGEDKRAIEAAIKQLNDVSIELGKAVYQATGASGGSAPGAKPGGDGQGAEKPSGKPGEEVIDAEYEVKEDR